MKISFFLLICALIGVNSCRENGTSPEGSGTIAGRVILFDSTIAVLTDYSGVQVSIDGTATSMITDSTGDWHFSGLSEGIYNITATKPGFGTFHWYQQDVNNGRIDEPTAELAEMPSFTPVVSSLLYQSGYGILNEFIRGAYDSLPQSVNIAGYCDVNPDASPSDAHLMVAINTDDWQGGGIYFSYNDLLAAGARPGDTLYLSAANVFVRPNAYDVDWHSTFIDPAHNGEMRYASNGPKSNVVTFKMP